MEVAPNRRSAWPRHRRRPAWPAAPATSPRGHRPRGRAQNGVLRGSVARDCRRSWMVDIALSGRGTRTPANGQDGQLVGADVSSLERAASTSTTSLDRADPWLMMARPAAVELGGRGSALGPSKADGVSQCRVRREPVKRPLALVPVALMGNDPGVLRPHRLAKVARSFYHVIWVRRRYSERSHVLEDPVGVRRDRRLEPYRSNLKAERGRRGPDVAPRPALDEAELRRPTCSVARHAPIEIPGD